MPAPEHSNVEEFPYIGEKFDIVDIVGEVSFDELFEGRVEMPAPIIFLGLMDNLTIRNRRGFSRTRRFNGRNGDTRRSFP